MAELLKVKLITPKEVAYDGDAVAVTVPAENGEMQIYQGHIPVLARVKSGIVSIERQEKEILHFEVDEGFLRVLQSKVDLLIDTAAPAKSR